MKAIMALLATRVLIASARDSAAQEKACGSLANGFGPLDCRAEGHAKRRIVEQNHLAPGKEAATGA